MDRLDLTVCTARKLLSRFDLRFLFCSCLTFGTLLPTVAAEPPATERASSSLLARQQVIRSIPFDQLSDVKRSKLEEIIHRPSLYRRLPVQVSDCDQQLFTFLVRNPEVVINMWQLMGATKIQFQRSGPYHFTFSDGAGTVSRIELVYGTPDLHIFYAEGSYSGPLITRPVRGRCVMVLNTSHPQQQGRQYLASRLDVFLQVDHLGVEWLAKTLHPLLGATVDKNYADTIRFIGQLSRASARNRAGIERLTARLTRLDPAVRTRFGKIVAQIAESAQTSAEHVASPLPTSKKSQRVE